MNTDIALSEPVPFEPAHVESSASADRRAEDAAYYREVLHGLIDMGAGVARRLHGSITAATTGDAEAAALGVAFERACRCVRRSVMLARALAEGGRGLPLPSPLPLVLGPAERMTARRTILRAVEDEIERSAEGEAAERLRAEALERLDRPELENDLARRPVAEIVKEIERDLGVGGSWKRRTPADVAVLCARAAALPGQTRMVPDAGRAVAPADAADAGYLEEAEPDACLARGADVLDLEHEGEAPATVEAVRPRMLCKGIVTKAVLDWEAGRRTAPPGLEAG